MKMLSSDAFARAVSLVKAKARALDRRLYEFHFESGPADAVISAIANYQNPDGGFGHALEPDFRLMSSSPTATAVAFEYLIEVNAHPDNPVVRKGIEYLLSAYDSSRGLWQNVPPEVNNVPHAPWWHFNKPAEVFQATCGAEIVAWLNAYPALVPPAILERVNYIALTTLVNLPDEMDMHDLLCYLRLAQEIPAPRDILVLTKLRHTAPMLVARDRGKWDQYGVKPLMLAPTPYAPLADLMVDDLNANLDWEIDHQSPAGSWVPTWAWGQYEDVWPEAALEWQGILTVKMLRSLKAFGRI